MTVKILIFKNDRKISYYVIITLVPMVPLDLKRNASYKDEQYILFLFVYIIFFYNMTLYKTSQLEVCFLPPETSNFDGYYLKNYRIRMYGFYIFFVHF